MSAEVFEYIKRLDERHPEMSDFDKFCEILWSFHTWHLSKTQDLDKTHEAFLERLWHFRNLRWKLETSSFEGVRQ